MQAPLMRYTAAMRHGSVQVCPVPQSNNISPCKCAFSHLLAGSLDALKTISHAGEELVATPLTPCMLCAVHPDNAE